MVLERRLWCVNSTTNGPGLDAGIARGNGVMALREGIYYRLHLTPTNGLWLLTVSNGERMWQRGG
jgi:hypothetical protein